LVEETGVPRENNGTVASHWNFFPHNVVSSTHSSSLYRSMWTIGQSQRVEEKKYRPIVRKIR
jgi:hypothetical protein